MNASKANLINSISLIAFGLWGYFEVTSPTALIPVGFGVVLLLCYNGVKTQNKVVAHIAVLLTLVILLALIGMRLPKSIESGGIGLFRVLAMCATSLIAMVYFVRSFIEARRKLVIFFEEIFHNFPFHHNPFHWLDLYRCTFSFPLH